jgi:hypothetical protein
MSETDQVFIEAVQEAHDDTCHESQVRCVLTRSGPGASS